MHTHECGYNLVDFDGDAVFAKRFVLFNCRTVSSSTSSRASWVSLFARARSHRLPLTVAGRSSGLARIHIHLSRDVFKRARPRCRDVCTPLRLTTGYELTTFWQHAHDVHLAILLQSTPASARQTLNFSYYWYSILCSDCKSYLTWKINLNCYLCLVKNVICVIMSLHTS